MMDELQELKNDKIKLTAEIDVLRAQIKRMEAQTGEQEQQKLSPQSVISEDLKLQHKIEENVQ